jgi:hypothetical protein
MPTERELPPMPTLYLGKTKVSGPAPGHRDSHRLRQAQTRRVKGINRPVPAAVLLFGTTTSPLVIFPLAHVSLKSRCLNTRTSEERNPVSSVIRSNGRRAGERLALAAAMSFDSSSELTARPTSWRSGKVRTRSTIGPPKSELAEKAPQRSYLVIDRAI